MWHSPRINRLVAALTLTFLIVGVTAGPAVAGWPVRETTIFAGAMIDSCSVNVDGVEVCTFASVEVYKSAKSWEVCVFRSTASFLPDANPVVRDEFGCTMAPHNMFSVKRKLTSAILEPVAVPLVSTICDEQGTCTDETNEVTTGITWTGVGELIRSRDKDSTQHGKCKVKMSGKRDAREAQATLTIDGATFQASNAILVNAQSFVKIGSHCP